MTDPPPSARPPTGPGGLSSAEAAQRLADDGPNRVVAHRPSPWWAKTGRQLADPLILLLVAAFVVTLAIGDHPDAAVIALVVVVNTAIGVVQELRADRAVAALDALAAPVATVRRDGVELSVPAAEVVAGDELLLAAGDVVAADTRLREAVRLSLDESAMTGESVSVTHSAGEDVLAGTVVLTGRGTGEVVRTGADSGLGRIASLVAGSRPGPTPLQRRLAGLGRLLGLVALVAAAVVFGIGVLSGRSALLMVVAAVSLVVAAVPESLPAVVTLSLALAARRMAALRAIPRRLHAVETLGSVTVVCSDKTGTLTEGQMSVRQAVDDTGASHEASGNGYDPAGSVTDAPELARLALAVALCNDATIAEPTPDKPQWTAIGDTLEAALVVFAHRCGLDVEKARHEWPRVDEQPFDQQTRRMLTVHDGPDHQRLAVCKGAPEAVLELVGADRLAGQRAAAQRLAEPRAAAQRLAEQGLRVLAVAAGDDPDHLRLLGLVGIGDPIRATARAVADDFAAAGIRLVLITGDHAATASAIGAHLGIWAPGEPVAEGDPDRDDVTVYARIQPEQKLAIVAALQRAGDIVAMTGDGVNDAPALRQADIGVAMGGGTDVARQAADLVLVDDNLATLTRAVGEGRRIYDNIRRFLLYGLAGGAAEILVMLVGPAVGLGLPLLPAQILWINLLTHGVPGVALGAEPAEAGTMRRSPRPSTQSVLGAGLARAVVRTGAILALVTVAAGYLAYRLDRPWQSILFTVLGLGQLGIALAVRVRGRGNPWLLVAVAISAVLQLAGLYLPPLRSLLGTRPLLWTELLVSIAAAILPGLVVFFLHRLRQPTPTGPAVGSNGPTPPSTVAGG